MDELLARTATKLKTKNYKNLTIVLGNESCDLDSAVCAIVYAAYLNWQHNKVTKHDVSETDDIFVPVLNVNREDYELKTEVVFVFKEQGVSGENVVFWDDYNWNELLSTGPSKVVLVDHHVLASHQLFLHPYVTEIIDHRPLANTDWCKNNVRSTIQIVGSCCTLVAQRIKDLQALIATDPGFFDTFPACARMLYATIILDTVNFSTIVNKATPHDVEMVQFLETLMKPADFETERTATLDALVAARSDVTCLTPAQLLRKDVKIVADVFVPSFPILVKEFLSRPGAAVAVTEALSRRGCDIALLLGMDLTGGLRRDVAIIGHTPDRVAQLTKHLEACQTPALGLVSEHIPVASFYYTQTNLSATRKQYRPAVQQFLNKS